MSDDPNTYYIEKETLRNNPVELLRLILGIIGKNPDDAERIWRDSIYSNDDH